MGPPTRPARRTVGASKVTLVLAREQALAEEHPCRLDRRALVERPVVRHEDLVDQVGVVHEERVGPRKTQTDDVALPHFMRLPGLQQGGV